MWLSCNLTFHRGVFVTEYWHLITRAINEHEYYPVHYRPTILLDMVSIS